MKQHHFQEKYPISEVLVMKSETTCLDTAAVVAYFEAHIHAADKAVYIATFNHFAHTKVIGGEIAENILNAFNVIFCFGHALPNAHVMAVRPRSIGITEFTDRFSITFMDAPMKPANDAMQSWALGLRNT